MTSSKGIVMRVRWTTAEGFTLLEVMIAISIMTTILVILFGTYSAAVERAARTRELSQMYHEARVLLQLIVNDLRSAYVKEATEQAQQALERTKTPPTSFIGEDRTEFDHPADKITLSTSPQLINSRIFIFVLPRLILSSSIISSCVNGSGLISKRACICAIVRLIPQ